MRRFLAVALAAVLLLTLSGTALAAKGGNKGGNTLPGSTSLTIVVPNGVFAGTTTATVSPGGSNLWVAFSCYQGGQLVMGANVPLDVNQQATVQLGPTPMWPGGAASCTAAAGTWNNGKWTTQASTTFSVSG